MFVEEQVRLILLTQGVNDMKVSYLDAAGDSNDNQEIDLVPSSTILTFSEAIEHLCHLSRYFYALPMNNHLTPAGSMIIPCTIVEQTTYLGTVIC